MKELQDYALTENPFEIVSHNHEMANRKEEWDRIVSSLRSGFKGRSPKLVFLLGDWGEGKSYLLERLHSWLSNEKENKRHVFIANLRARVLYQKPLAIRESEPRWSKFGLDFMTRVLGRIERERWKGILSKVDLASFDSPFRVVFEGLRDSKASAFRFIEGQKLSAAELKELGVAGPLTDSPQVIDLFFNVLQVIRLAEYTNFLLLLDEFEYITAVLGEVRITQVLNTFREIFDRCGHYGPAKIANPIFMFAISHGGWDRLQELERTARRKTGGGGIAPFMERVSRRDIIALKPFGVEESKELVMLRLAEKRTQKLDDPFWPFTEKSIEYVHSLSFNKPRNVIDYCGILLQDALEEDLGKIDEADARRILQRYGITPELENTHESAQ